MNDNNSHVVDHQNDNDHNHTHSPTSSSYSISQKLHSSICNMSCCFRNSKHQQQPISPVHVSKTRLLHSSSVWIKSRAAVAHVDHHLPEIKDKCRTLMSRIHSHHRRRHSAEFHYDALSYSRNFDDDLAYDNDDAFPFKSFSSRLPHSPPLHNVLEHHDDDDDDDDDDEPPSQMASSSSSASSALVSPSKTSEIVRAYS